MYRKLGAILRGIQDLRAIDISDDYTEWLAFANVGMLMKGNLYCFDYAIRNMPGDAPIVEIGTFCGLSTNTLVYYKHKNGRKNRLITSEKWSFESFVEGETICERPVAEYEDFVRQNYIRNIQMFSRNDLPYTVSLWSDEFFAAWDKNLKTQDVLGREIELGGPISFAYIDGNHSYEYAQRDFLNCHRYLLPGGFVLFDDSRDFGPHECRKVAQEAARRPDYELVIKNPNYLLRKIK